MITEIVNGNIIDTDLKFIAHGCNAQGVMRSGVAKAIREKWPTSYQKYHEAWTCLGSKELKMGSVIVAVEKEKVIFNCITQRFFGRDGKRYVNYSAITRCFNHINKIIPNETMAIPMIGAGLGGGDWKVIKDIINTATPDVNIHLHVI